MGESNIWDAKKLADLNKESISKISEVFGQFLSTEDCCKMNTEAEIIKSAFYKRLVWEKSEAEGKPTELEGLTAAEDAFKSMYVEFKNKRTLYNKEIREQKLNNLAAKKQILEDLKTLIAEEETIDSFKKFRELTNKWNEVGQVPASDYRTLNNEYHSEVEKFYDSLTQYTDQRDADFAENLKKSQELCEMAESLAGSEDAVKAHKDFQTVCKKWREIGPVATDLRKQIRERFQASSYKINRKHQKHFEIIKEREEDNLKRKTVFCEEVEAFAKKEIDSASEWNDVSNKIQKIQTEWRKVGFAPRKENKAIYDRFREACDQFFNRRKEFFDNFREVKEENTKKKMDIIKRAEELSQSKEWKATTDKMIALQNEWKEVGPVVRGKAQKLWKEFRTHCDNFFNAKDEHFKALREERTNDNRRKARKGGNRRPQRMSENDRLIREYNELKQQIAQFENNLGYFGTGPNADKLVEMMNKRIEDAKKKLASLELKIRRNENRITETCTED